MWASGGHYKAEDLNQRAAALLATGSYVPLAQLIDDFYPVQHEIGYLEAGGFVTYLVDRGGWSRFKEFYSDVASDDGATLSAAVDANLQAYYGMTLAQLESEWLAALQSRPADPLVVDDLKTTVRYYDVVRRYQAAYDPTAHFLSAWLPHPNQVRELGKDVYKRQPLAPPIGRGIRTPSPFGRGLGRGSASAQSHSDVLR